MKQIQKKNNLNKDDNSIQGAVFDFNGTLFWDSQLHLDTWRKFSTRLRERPFTDEEMLEHMFGRTNYYIVKYLIGEEPSEELVEKYAQEKEQYYRDMCCANRNNLCLAPGAVDFLDFLKANKIKMAIATMSEWSNVEFYIKEFNLEKWFEIDNICYSDGTIPGKPAPDIYELAMQKINVKPQNCLVVEDAISGLEAARNAKVGKIIAIASREAKEYYKDLNYVDSIITDFSQIDRSMFV